MPILGITGGIATGKSSFTQSLLRTHLSAEVFDADACARLLVERDENVRRKIREHFGDAVFDSTGELQRNKLREMVFHDENARLALEAILHPVIRETWQARAEAARKETRWFFADIPLLFETGAEKLLDFIVVVACSANVQRKRLSNNRNLPAALAEKIVAAQMPLDEKIARADCVIWNDGTPEALDAQTTLFNSYLKLRYG